jgi:uncharacterized protein (UPF0333 family)
MKMNLLVLPVALLLSTSPSHAEKASANRFQTYANGTLIAHSNYTIQQNKNGITAQSSINYVEKKDGTTTNIYNIGSDGIINQATLDNSASKLRVIYATDKGNDQLSISMQQYGRPMGGRKLPLKPPADFVVAFDDDPSVYEALIDVTTADPHPSSQYMLLIPGKSKSEPDRLEPYILSKELDQPKGTLDGQEVTLTHYSLRFSSGKGDIYTDKDGSLMEADMAPLHTQQVRVGFALTK